MKQYLDTDPLTGMRRWYEYDEGEDRSLIHTETDITATLENNKRLRNDGTGGWSADRNWKRIADIPIAMFDMWKSMYGLNLLKRENKDFLMRLLDDPDLRYLRTDK